VRKRGNGYHEVFGVELRRVTSILDRLKRWGLDEWQASCAIDFIMSELVAPLAKGWMTLQQLQETDLERIRDGAMDEARKKMKASQTLGRRVHDAIHGYYKATQNRALLERIAKAEPELEPGIRGFMAWEDEFKVEMVFSERLVFSFSRKYSGQLDLQAKIILPSENCGEDPPRRLYVVDFKTGNPDPKHVIQIAAYAMAVEEMGRREVDGAGLVYLDQDTGKPRWKGYERRQLLMPFMMFEKIKGFCDLEDEWKRGDSDFEEGPPANDTSPAAAPAATGPAGPPIFE
jgi:CRISPR/Cas system-associated exonuclease Cas4 (RecB family)